MKKPRSVPESLESLGNIYKERNALYGDNYKIFGRVMAGMFPEGIVLSSVDDHNKFGIFVQMVSKLTRISANIFNPHEDSLDDLSVYSQMLKELTGEFNTLQDPLHIDPSLCYSIEDVLYWLELHRNEPSGRPDIEFFAEGMKGTYRIGLEKKCKDTYWYEMPSSSSSNGSWSSVCKNDNVPAEFYVAGPYQVRFPESEGKRDF